MRKLTATILTITLFTILIAVPVFAENLTLGTEVLGSATAATFDNTVIGSYSFPNALGYGNVSLGMWNGGRLTTGNYNILIGYVAGDSLTTQSNKLYIQTRGANPAYGIFGDFSTGGFSINKPDSITFKGLDIVGALAVSGDFTVAGIELSDTLWVVMNTDSIGVFHDGTNPRFHTDQGDFKFNTGIVAVAASIISPSLHVNINANASAGDSTAVLGEMDGGGNGALILLANDTDSLTISHNGTDAIFHTETGDFVFDANIGIGTDNPGSLVELYALNATVYDDTDVGGQQTGTATLIINNPHETIDTFTQIVFKNRLASISVSRIVSVMTGTNTADLAFVTESAGGNAERMRIKSSGNVGFGTATSIPNQVTVITDFGVYANTEPSVGDSSVTVTFTLGSPVLTFLASDAETANITHVVNDTLKFDGGSFYAFDNVLHLGSDIDDVDGSILMIAQNNDQGIISITDADALNFTGFLGGVQSKTDMWADDFYLGFDGTSAKLTTASTDEDMTIAPNGNGSITFYTTELNDVSAYQTAAAVFDVDPDMTAIYIWLTPSDNGTEVDQSPHSQDATYVDGSNWTADDQIPVGLTWALDFDINTDPDYLTIPDDALWSWDDSGSNPHSIGFWAQVVATADTQVFIAKYDASGTPDREWSIYLDANEILIYESYDEANGVSIINYTDAAPSDGWHLFVHTYDSTGGGSAFTDASSIWYIDGVAVAESQSNDGSYVNSVAGATVVTIGADNHGLLGNYWTGDMGILFVVPNELTADAVWQIYLSTRGYYGK